MVRSRSAAVTQRAHSGTMDRLGCGCCARRPASDASTGEQVVCGWLRPKNGRWSRSHSSRAWWPGGIELWLQVRFPVSLHSISGPARFYRWRLVEHFPWMCVSLLTILSWRLEPKQRTTKRISMNDAIV